ncbi:MAG: hypothetical protein NZ777_11665 [Pseudomonadales bacterium]|nr:hypothetical protein [Pseudomonadales bacterium]
MYHEQRIPWWTGLLVFMTLAVAGGLIVTVNEYSDLQQTATPEVLEQESVGYIVGILTCGVTEAILLLCTVVFWKYFITVDRDLVRFGFSWWNVTFNLDQIEDVELDQARFSEFFGFGWRISMKNKRIGYIVNLGASVGIQLKTGRAYLISCRDPEACIAAIRQSLP